MDEFKVEWTFRDPMTTVTYPAGHRDNLPDHIRMAAKADGALVEDDAAPDDAEPATPSPRGIFRRRAKPE